jgi:hypothetical protein
MKARLVASAGGVIWVGDGVCIGLLSACLGVVNDTTIAYLYVAYFLLVAGCHDRQRLVKARHLEQLALGLRQPPHTAGDDAGPLVAQRQPQHLWEDVVRGLLARSGGS